MVLYKGILNMIRTLKIYWDYEMEVLLFSYNIYINIFLNEIKIIFIYNINITFFKNKYNIKNLI